MREIWHSMLAIIARKPFFLYALATLLCSYYAAAELLPKYAESELEMSGSAAVFASSAKSASSLVVQLIFLGFSVKRSGGEWNVHLFIAAWMLFVPIALALALAESEALFWAIMVVAGSVSAFRASLTLAVQ